MLKARLSLLGALCGVLAGAAFLPSSAYAGPACNCPDPNLCYTQYCVGAQGTPAYQSCIQSCTNSINGCYTSCPQ